MKILQVTPLYFPSLGGVQLYVKEISEALVALGHEVTVATMAHDNSLPKIDNLAGVEIKRFSALGPQAYHIPIGLYKFLIQYGSIFDVVHAHNYGGLPLLLAALACSDHTVITPHYHGHGNSLIANLMHRIYDPLASPLLKKLGGVVCVSRGEAQFVVQKLGISPNSINVIPNSINFPSCFNINEKEQIITNQGNSLFLLCVGRLVKYKRIDRIITTLPYLPKYFKLALIGEGPHKEKLEKLARSLNVQDRILFLGTVSNDSLVNWYSRSKVVISLSEGEAFGRVIVEGLASNCHIVCSDILAFQDFALEYPKSVSLISSKLTSNEIARVIRDAADCPMDNPPNVEPYKCKNVISELIKVYVNINERNIAKGISNE